VPQASLVASAVLGVFVVLATPVRALMRQGRAGEPGRQGFRLALLADQRQNLARLQPQLLGHRGLIEAQLVVVLMVDLAGVVQ